MVSHLNGKRTFNKESLLGRMYTRCQRLVRRANSGVILPLADNGEGGMIENARRLLGNRVTVFPRADHGEYALLENLRRAYVNRVTMAPMVDNGEFALVEKLRLLTANHCNTCAIVADGSTNGKVKTTAAAEYSIAGKLYTKAATDDLWDCSALADTGVGEYVSIALWLDTGGTATVTRGTVAASADAADAYIWALVVATPTKCLIGVLTVAPSKTMAGDLAAAGTFHSGYPASTVFTAVTARTETLIADGSAAGKFKLSQRIQYTNDLQPYFKAATDDLWDLTGITGNGAAEYAGHFLCLDNGTASVVSTAKVASAAAAATALALLIPATKAVIGTFISGLNCVFTNALTAQGTLTQGIPEAVVMAAVTAQTETIVADGGTNGKFKLSERIGYTNDDYQLYKAATDDLWDLTGVVNNSGAQYAGHFLVLDGGTASVVSTAKCASAAAALTALAAAIPDGKAIIATFVSGLSCNFSAALTAQGTLYQGVPEACFPAAVTGTTSTILADGTTAGKIKTSNVINFKINGTKYVKAATDDLWNLAAEVDTAAGKYRAYNLFLSTAGAASFAAGDDCTTAALALASAEAVRFSTTHEDKALIGVVTCAPATDFNHASGLVGQGGSKVAYIDAYEYSLDEMTEL